jgi:hypothetical protein
MYLDLAFAAAGAFASACAFGFFFKRSTKVRFLLIFAKRF